VEKIHEKDQSLQNILRLVADNSDFLVDKQLNDLLGPHTDKEKMLIKIDSILTVVIDNGVSFLSVSVICLHYKHIKTEN
jgi:hypothetical protein